MPTVPTQHYARRKTYNPAIFKVFQQQGVTEGAAKATIIKHFPYPKKNKN